MDAKWHTLTSPNELKRTTLNFGSLSPGIRLCLGTNPLPNFPDAMARTSTSQYIIRRFDKSPAKAVVISVASDNGPLKIPCSR